MSAHLANNTLGNETCGSELLSTSSAISFYLEECKKSGANPLHTFTKQLSADTVVFDFSNNYLGEEGIKPVIKTLSRVPLQVLWIANCALDRDSVAVLCDGLAFHPTLEKIDLRGNAIDELGGRKILNLVRQSKTLCEVLLDAHVPKYKPILQQCNKNKGLDQYLSSCFVCKKVVEVVSRGPGDTQYQNVEAILLRILFTDYWRVADGCVGVVECEVIMRLILFSYHLQGGSLSLCSPSCGEKLVGEWYQCFNAVRKTNWFGMQEGVAFPTISSLKHQTESLIQEFSDRTLTEEDYFGVRESAVSVTVKGRCSICGDIGVVFSYGFLHLVEQLYSDVMEQKVSLTASSLKRVAQSILDHIHCTPCSVTCVKHLIRFALFHYGGVNTSPSTEEPLLSTVLVELSECPSIPFRVGSQRDPSRNDYIDPELCCAQTVAREMESIEGLPIDPFMIFAMGRRLNQQECHTIGMKLHHACQAVRLVGCLTTDEWPLQNPVRSQYASWEGWTESVPDTEKCLYKAFSRRRQGLFVVDGYQKNMFDNIRTALWTFRSQRRSVLVVVEFSISWLSLLHGVIPEELPPTTGFFTSVRATGVTTIEEQWFLILETNFGKEAGNGGIFYMNREMFNKCASGVPYMFLDTAVFSSMSSLQAEKYYKTLLAVPVQETLQSVYVLDPPTLCRVLRRVGVKEDLMKEFLSLVKSRQFPSQVAFFLSEVFPKEAVLALKEAKSTVPSDRRANGPIPTVAVSSNVRWMQFSPLTGNPVDTTDDEENKILPSLIPVLSGNERVEAPASKHRLNESVDRSGNEVPFLRRWHVIHHCDARQNFLLERVFFLVDDHVCGYDFLSGRVTDPLTPLSDHAAFRSFPFLSGVSALFHHPLRHREVYLFCDGFWCLWDAHQHCLLAGPFSIAQHALFKKLPPPFRQRVTGAIPLPGTSRVLFYSDDRCTLVDVDKGTCCSNVVPHQASGTVDGVPSSLSKAFPTPPHAVLWNTERESPYLVVLGREGTALQLNCRDLHGKALVQKMTEIGFSDLPAIFLGHCAKTLPELIEHFETVFLSSRLDDYESFDEEKFLVKYAFNNKSNKFIPAGSGEVDHKAVFSSSHDFTELRDISKLFRTNASAGMQDALLSEEAVLQGTEGEGSTSVLWDWGNNGEESFGALLVLIQNNGVSPLCVDGAVEISYDGLFYEEKTVLRTVEDDGALRVLYGDWPAGPPSRYWRLSFHSPLPSSASVVRTLFYRTRSSASKWRTYSPLQHHHLPFPLSGVTVRIQAPQTWGAAEALLREDGSPVFATSFTPSPFFLGSFYRKRTHSNVFLFLESCVEQKEGESGFTFDENSLLGQVYSKVPFSFKKDMKSVFVCQGGDIWVFFNGNTLSCWDTVQSREVTIDSIDQLREILEVELGNVSCIFNKTGSTDVVVILYRQTGSPRLIAVEYDIPSMQMVDKKPFSQFLSIPEELLPKEISSVEVWSGGEGGNSFILNRTTLLSFGSPPKVLASQSDFLPILYALNYFTEVDQGTTVTVDLGPTCAGVLISGISLSCLHPVRVAQRWAISYSENGVNWHRIGEHHQDGITCHTSWDPTYPSHRTPQYFQLTLLDPLTDSVVVYTRLAFSSLPFRELPVRQSPRRLGLTPGLALVKTADTFKFQMTGEEKAPKILFDFDKVTPILGISLTAITTTPSLMGSPIRFSVVGSRDNKQCDTVVEFSSRLTSHELVFKWYPVHHYKSWALVMHLDPNSDPERVSFSMPKFYVSDCPLMELGGLPVPTHLLYLNDPDPTLLFDPQNPLVLDVTDSFGDDGTLVAGFELFVKASGQGAKVVLECRMENDPWQCTGVYGFLSSSCDSVRLELGDHPADYPHWRIRVMAEAPVSCLLRGVRLLTTRVSFYQRLCATSASQSEAEKGEVVLSLDRPSRVTMLTAVLPPDSIFVVESLSVDEEMWYPHGTLVNPNLEETSFIRQCFPPLSVLPSTHWMLRFMGNYSQKSAENLISLKDIDSTLDLGEVGKKKTATSVCWYGLNAMKLSNPMDYSVRSQIQCVGFQLASQTTSSTAPDTFASLGSDAVRSIQWTFTRPCRLHALTFVFRLLGPSSSKDVSFSCWVENSENGIDFIALTPPQKKDCSSESSVFLSWEENAIAAVWRLTVLCSSPVSFCVTDAGFRTVVPTMQSEWLPRPSLRNTTLESYLNTIFNTDDAFRAACEKSFETVNVKTTSPLPSALSREELVANQILKRKRIYQKYIASCIKEVPARSELGAGNINALELIEVLKVTAVRFKNDSFADLATLLKGGPSIMEAPKFQNKSKWFFPSMEVFGTFQTPLCSIPVTFAVYWSMSFEVQRNHSLVSEETVSDAVNPHIASPFVGMCLSADYCRERYPAITSVLEEFGLQNKKVTLVVASNELTFTKDYPLPSHIGNAPHTELKVFRGLNFVLSASPEECTAVVMRSVEKLSGGKVPDKPIPLVFHLPSESSPLAVLRFTISSFHTNFNVAFLNVDRLEFEISIRIISEDALLVDAPMMRSAVSLGSLSSASRSIKTSPKGTRRKRKSTYASSSPIASILKDIRYRQEYTIRFIGRGGFNPSPSESTPVTFVGDWKKGVVSVTGCLHQDNIFFPSFGKRSQTEFSFSVALPVSVPTDLLFWTSVSLSPLEHRSELFFAVNGTHRYLQQNHILLRRIHFPKSPVSLFLSALGSVVPFWDIQVPLLKGFPVAITGTIQLQNGGKSFHGNGFCSFFQEPLTQATVTGNIHCVEVQTCLERLSLGDLHLESSDGKGVHVSLRVDRDTLRPTFTAAGVVQQCCGIDQVPFSVRWSGDGVSAYGDLTPLGTVTFKADSLPLLLPSEAAVTLRPSVVEDSLLQHLLQTPIVARLSSGGIPPRLCLYTLEIPQCLRSALPVYLKGVFFGVFFESCVLFFPPAVDVTAALGKRLAEEIVEKCEEALYAAYGNVIGFRSIE